MDDLPTTRQVPIVWTEDQRPALFVNQALSQFQDDYFVVTFGQAQPPLLLGDEAARVVQLGEIEFVQVNPVVRLGMSRKVMGEVVDLLKQNLEAYDKAHTARRPKSDDV